MYSSCIDSVKILFSDKFTMSVSNNLGLLESPGLGHQSVASWSRRSGSHLSHDHYNSGFESDRGMEDIYSGYQCSSRHDPRDELVSPPRSQASASGIGQSGHAEESSSSREPSPQGTRGQEALYSRSGDNPIHGIADTRKCKAYTEVFNAFMDQPKKC